MNMQACYCPNLSHVARLWTTLIIDTTNGHAACVYFTLQFMSDLARQEGSWRAVCTRQGIWKSSCAE